MLGPGDVFLNADFGYRPPAAQNNSVGDRVWFDVNADGVQDAGEPGIPGVTVALIKDSNGNGAWDAGEPIIGTTTTVANGFYQFSGLPDGKYLVWVNDTDSVLGDKVQTFDSDGVATPNISKVDLDAAGANPNPVSNQDQDFGYTAPGQQPGKGLIGDTVFLDRNANNLPDAGEGIEGVTVRLYDSTGTTLLATTTTDENGNYWFGGLNPTATYQVRVDTTTLPAGPDEHVRPRRHAGQPVGAQPGCAGQRRRQRHRTASTTASTWARTSATGRSTVRPAASATWSGWTPTPTASATGRTAPTASPGRTTTSLASPA